MLARLRPLAALERLRSTYWFIPSLLTGAAIGLALLLTAIDRFTPDTTVWLGWAYGGGADGARALLSAVAGSMITVVSVTFSVTVVALTVSSQHFGPRLLRSFMRDQPAQLVLGTFTGTFAYCLMVLRTVQGDDGDGYSFFVPHLAVTGGVALALAAVGLLIYYVHHIAISMQVSEIARRITHELEHTIDRLYPDPIGEGIEPAARTPPPPPRDVVHAAARVSGYVQEINGQAVLDAAEQHQISVWLIARPGDFVVEGEPIAAIHPIPADGTRCAESVAEAYAIGTDRTPQQDAAFAVQQLVEVALRALSPGMNEPFTAITAIDRLGQALSKFAGRRIPSAIRTGKSGAIRVVAAAQTFEDLVQTAFEPIALYAGQNPEIFTRLLVTIERLARVARRPADRTALARLCEIVRAAAEREVHEDRHLLSLARLYGQVQHTIEAEPMPTNAHPRAS